MQLLAIDDHIMALVESLAEQQYGERLDMLSHSLQAAASAEADGADPALVLAALLHDIGHLFGATTKWGRPDHAVAGATFLQMFLPDAVVEPIRLHVDAKRYLVAVDPEYMNELSEASVATLAQQGGPFDAAAVAAFERSPYADDAVRVRRWDDAGKQPGVVGRPLQDYRPLLASMLAAAPMNPAWARDACECSQCRDPQTGQHLIGAHDLPGWSVEARGIAGEHLVVDLVRPDGDRHRCEIPLGQQLVASPPPALWRSDQAKQVKEPCSSTDAFSASLSSAGIALIDGIPTEPGQVLEFARSIGFVRETNYGALFDVVASDTPNNLAFTSLGLPLHTDNPYRDPVPTVQLLHCLRSAESGGGSIFCDGFAVAEHFRIVDPEGFSVLSTTPVTFHFADDEVVLCADTPIIDVDARGNVRRIAVNHRSMRAPGSGVDGDAFYDAYVRFNELLASDVFVISLDLAPGQLIGFDNRRVLHGRSGFGSGGARHLQGCYIDIDAVHSTALLVSSG